MSASSHPSPYCQLLQGCATLSNPLSATVFTMLTTLVQPHELYHPATRVRDGELIVELACSRRRVPLSEATLSVLGVNTAHLRALLHIDHTGRLHPGELCAAYDDAPAPFAGVDLDQLVPLALHHLVSTAGTRSLRAGVLAYAGLPDGRPEAGSLTDPRRLSGVAALIDAAVKAAGYAAS